ncbi:MAG: tetratricopeptide repeat protein [Betaproteobacteria bacterium]|nr:tetratricopeptide repeat protein [Betaproteobacteria bacterium]
MFKVKKLRWMISITLLMASCTSMQKASDLDGIEIKPMMRINHANGSPKIMYLLGRYHQGKLDYRKAIAAYEKALAVKPDYVEVHNGLGVIYSMQGRHELALQHFHKAIELAPQEAYLYSNLGYAHLIQSNLAEAIESLNKAVSLDPKNKSARLNLEIAQKKNRLENKAVALQQNPINPPSLATQELSKVDTNAVDDNTPKFHENSMLLNNTGMRLEVSNGNGITGMAKQISAFLQQHGITKVRLTNHRAYNQNQTEIYYRPGNYQQAFQVNQMLPMQAKLIESNELRRDIQIKILLGQDFPRKAAYSNKKEQMKISQQHIENNIN